MGFINFYDDNFTLNQARVAEICETILRHNLKVDWKCEGRVDNADLELLKLMRRAGCRTIAYGVESAKPQTLPCFAKTFRLSKPYGPLNSLEKRVCGALPI